MYMKNIIKTLNYALGAYIIYIIIFGGIILGFYKHNISNYLETHPVERFWGEKTGQDRVVLVEDRYNSGIARIDFIENAKETLDISYYRIDNGISSDIFLGCVLNAADRGVKVRLLLDGSLQNIIEMKEAKYTIFQHPNIELKFYDTSGFFRPWSWNNRLHDKYIIADNHIAMIGGRNIGDRYFAKERKNGDIVNDRDVVIINTDSQNTSNSAIYQMKEYFNYVWNHKYSKCPVKKLTQRQERKGQAKAEYLNKNIEKVRKDNPEMFNQSIDWLAISLPTNKVTLIHNPIERFNKEPWCWYEIINLAERAKESIFIQSPYIIPTKDMLKHIGTIDVPRENIDILTNSLASTPNAMAYSGHTRHRKKMVDFGANVYEFQGPGSIHAKSYIFDGRISLVGSFNMDSRSTYLSTETMVVIDSKEFANHLKKVIKDNSNNSLKVLEDYSYEYNSAVEEGEVPLNKVIKIRILSIITYLFDYML